MDCLLLDCQKAFVTVPNRRLLKKLDFQAGVRGKCLNGLKAAYVEEGRKHM